MFNFLSYFLFFVRARIHAHNANFLLYTIASCFSTNSAFIFSPSISQSTHFIRTLIRSLLINGMCLFGVGGARRRPHRASSLTISTSDCAVLLRSWRTKRGGIMREMSLSMRALSVVPRYAVVVGPSSKAQRGNGIGETP